MTRKQPILDIQIINPDETVQISPLPEDLEIVQSQYSILADGTQVLRMYADEVLENKRLAALNTLGTRWLHHPANKVSKGMYEENAVAQMTRKNHFLTSYFDTIRSQQLNIQREIANV
jgi:hypothetical protein